MLEEEYDKSRRSLPRHLRRRADRERPFSFEIRPAREADIPDIREIYNYYVTNSVVTFDEKRWTLGQWPTALASWRPCGPLRRLASPDGRPQGSVPS